MYLIDESSCTGCGSCIDACPRDAIIIERGVARIDHSICDECGACFSVCPQGAVYQEEASVAVAGSAQPSRVTVSPVVPVKRSRRWIAALATLAPAALDLATELARAIGSGRGSRPASYRRGSTPSKSAKSYNRHRWRGGRD